MFLVEVSDASTYLWSYQENLSLRPDLFVKGRCTTSKDEARKYLKDTSEILVVPISTTLFPKGFFLC